MKLRRNGEGGENDEKLEDDHHQISSGAKQQSIRCEPDHFIKYIDFSE